MKLFLLNSFPNLRKPLLGATAAIMAMAGVNAQNASGTVEFHASNSNGNVNVELVDGRAESLETSDIYDINGNTNEAIPFNWNVLGVENYNNLENIVFPNPSNELHAFFKNVGEVDARTYNILGQQVSTPQIINHGNITEISDPMNGFADGMYIIKVVGEQGESQSIKFLKNNRIISRDNGISPNLERTLENKSRSPSGQNRMVDNYNIVWNNGWGVLAGNQNVTIVPGTGNVIEVSADAMEDPFYTYNASIVNGTSGTATYNVDGGPTYQTTFPNTTFSLSDILSQFDIVNAVDDLSGNLNINGPGYDFNTALNLTMDGEGEIIVNGGPFDVGTSTGLGDQAVLTELNGTSQTGINVLARNTQTNQTWNLTEENNDFVFFQDLTTNNPTTYEFTVNSTEGDDAPFLETIVNDPVFEGSNPTLVVDVIPVPNEVDITTTARDYETLATISGATIKYYDASNNNLLATGVTDSNGRVTVNDIVGGQDIYLEISKTGYQTKGNKPIYIDLVDTVGEMTDTLNITGVQLKYYDDGEPITAPILNAYRPLADNTPLALDDYKKHYPSSPDRAAHIAHEEDLLALLGKAGALDASSTTPYPDPTTNGTYALYQPYPENRNTPSTIGTNVTNYNGTGTGTGTKVLSNGNLITFYTQVYNLGGLDWSATDHEHGNAYGFPLLSVSWATSRDPVAAINVPVAESETDQKVMSMWLRLQELNYNTTDTNGDLIDYQMTYNFEN